MEHDFTPVIRKILTKHFKDKAEDLFEKSPLLQYINLKTVSATRGSKARSSFANLYAIYVLAEDYIKHGYHKKGDYSKYEGAQFSKLFKRQRELPFGRKLQIHALNHRMNEEFRKFFPQIDAQLTFVIKSSESVGILSRKLREGAERQYAIKAIVDKYMACIEEIINISMLQERFRSSVAQGYLSSIMDEIVRQSKVEFNYEEPDDEDDEDE